MKLHFSSLDGLRGVAALTVLAHHLQGATGKLYGSLWAGYLSVDFFFVLSGFVIAAAYEQKFANGLNLWRFARLRLDRLYPMVFAGAFVACAVAIAMNGTVSPVGALAHFLLLPALAGGGVLFVLNAPFWSLFFEVGANFAHRLLFRVAPTPVLIIGVALAASGVLFAAHTFGNLGGGWGLNNWWSAVPRVAFGYGIGVLVYRAHAAGRLPKIEIPFPILAGLFVGAILLASSLHHWASDAAVALLVGPALLVAAIHGRAGRVSKEIGKLSYPLYAIHGPLVVLWASLSDQRLASSVVAFFGLAGLAWLVERFYETPARQWIKTVTLPPGSPVSSS